MSKYLFQIIIALFVMGFLGCNGKEKDPILVEAFEMHKEAVHIATEAVEVWEKLPANDTMRAKFDERLQTWGNDFIEVPGFHYHHDGLGHHHNRAPLKLSPEDVLLVQKEFRDSITSILQRIKMYEAAIRE